MADRVVVALVVGWWINHREAGQRHEEVVAHAERLRDALKEAKWAYEASNENFEWMSKHGAEGQFDVSLAIPYPPDWKIIDEPIDKP